MSDQPIEERVAALESEVSNLKSRLEHHGITGPVVETEPESTEPAAAESTEPAQE